MSWSAWFVCSIISVPASFSSLLDAMSTLGATKACSTMPLPGKALDMSLHLSVQGNFSLIPWGKSRIETKPGGGSTRNGIKPEFATGMTFHTLHTRKCRHRLLLSAEPDSCPAWGDRPGRTCSCSADSQTGVVRLCFVAPASYRNRHRTGHSFKTTVKKLITDSPWKVQIDIALLQYANPKSVVGNFPNVTRVNTQLYSVQVERH